MTSSIHKKDEQAVTDREYRMVMADLFHALNQPLTTLGCCLSVSLQKPLLAKQYQENLKVAWRQTESISLITAAVRELVDSGDPQTNLKPVRLDDCLREVISVLVPVARRAGIKLDLNISELITIRFEHSRLQQAIFRLLQFALGSAPTGSRIELVAKASKLGARLSLHVSSRQSPSSVKPIARHRPVVAGPRFDVVVARRIFESAGCSFRLHHSPGSSSVEVRLPLARREPAEPLSLPSRRCG